ncbi:hypothetical protein PISMIDRAFT_19696 [Pisolithus microcarpus 441]|uniref:Unplaced genomic scaffold scaffold_583, whole genome shotgun sequence n=1 Tax=Pisolithus microcarpus 441 TaxID=765257 RepID=A0A0C9YLR3_9AGAM|nr:hypothetical protein PISMIDRAFT_19696 [Pisolithus microcarpus 441]
MSTTKAATSTKTSTKPRYLSPDASHELIPKMWATNMERLGSLMREIPDEAAAEDVAREWMDEYYEVSDHIEGLWQFAADLSTEVPDYPKETQEAIGSGFLELSKPKPAPRRTSGSQAGGETTRQSQRQLEKATARGSEGDKDLSTSGGCVPIEAAATGPEESATQGLGGCTEVPTLGMQVETEACEWCMKRGVECVWKDGVACEACHIGKKRCGKAGKPGRKRKNPDAPPASSASMSKRARTTSVPPPSSSAPPKVTLKVRPRVVSQAIPAAEAAPSLPMPQDIPSASVSTLPGVLLFLPSSRPTTPTPTPNPQDPTPPPSPVDHDPIDVSVAFMPVPGGILDEGNMGTDDTPADVEEIDLTTPRVLPLPEEDRSPFKELDARIAAIEESIEWGEETLLDLYSQMAQVTANAGQVSTALRRAKLQLRSLKKWRRDSFVEGP